MLISQRKSALELDAKLISYEISEFCKRDSPSFSSKNALPLGNSTISKKELQEGGC
jgi:hypothetical protein